VTVRFGLSVTNCGVVIGAGNPKDLISMCEAADASELFDAVFTGDNGRARGALRNAKRRPTDRD
jgi:hypothetical protein